MLVPRVGTRLQARDVGPLSSAKKRTTCDFPAARDGVTRKRTARTGTCQAEGSARVMRDILCDGCNAPPAGSLAVCVGMGWVRGEGRGRDGMGSSRDRMNATDSMRRAGPPQSQSSANSSSTYGRINQNHRGLGYVPCGVHAGALDVHLDRCSFHPGLGAQGPSPAEDSGPSGD